MTVPAPAMSHFMSSIPPAGLMEMPPVSKVTPLPTKQIGRSVPGLRFVPPRPFQRITTIRASLALPCATPSIAPKLSLRSSFGPRTSTCTPSFSSGRQRSANSAGVSTLGGSVDSSRARNTPSATAFIGAKAARAAVASAVATVSFASFALSSSFMVVR